MYNSLKGEAWNELYPKPTGEALENWREYCEYERTKQILDMKRTIDELKRTIGDLQREMSKPALTNRQTEKALTEGFVKYLEKNPPKII